jgi:ATP-dependent Clp protease protease subunit
MKLNKLLAMLALCVVPFGTHANETKPKLLTLTKRNTVVLRGAVSATSVAELQVELLAMSAKLKSNETIYLVLDTPGGSVSAGLELIDFAQALPQRIKTLTLFAASMGFQIAQNMDERLILPSSTLMSHRASLDGLGGELPGELLSRLKYIMQMLTRMDKSAAKRMGMSLKKYQDLIRDELWMTGHEAVEMKAADRVILAKCDSTFQGTKRVIVGSIFGIEVSAEMSNCPLITGVMNVRLEGGTSKEAQEYAQAYQISKRSVVQKFICTGRLL